MHPFLYLEYFLPFFSGSLQYEQLVLLIFAPAYISKKFSFIYFRCYRCFLSRNCFSSILWKHCQMALFTYWVIEIRCRIRFLISIQSWNLPFRNFFLPFQNFTNSLFNFFFFLYRVCVCVYIYNEIMEEWIDWLQISISTFNGLISRKSFKRKYL